MTSEIIEASHSSASLMPITERDLESMKKQRDLLKKFISSQMKEADFSNEYAEGYGDGDYGIIPGTKKKTLLKPGAEKLLRLFGLGVRVKLVDKIIDKEANFALFIYRAEVYHLRTGVLVAECEGSVNSQEKKYKERTVWKKKKAKNGREISESSKEETPIFDVLNTLMKMSQKRAIVGATIVATAASDFFTQDMEIDETPEETKVGNATQEPIPEQPEGSPPVCCGKSMMISKYPDRETGEFPYYCTKCRKKSLSKLEASP